MPRQRRIPLFPADLLLGLVLLANANATELTISVRKEYQSKKAKTDWVQVVDGPCSFCADGTEADMFLTSRQLGMSCNDVSALANQVQQSDQRCSALQVLGYQECGCPTYPENYCSLCHGGFFDIPNTNTTVPSKCGKSYTCKDILFVEESFLSKGCDSLSPYRELCGCPSASMTCPICDQTSQDYHRTKLYKEYGLTCENLGMAQEIGNYSSCFEIQMKFRYFCGCAGAIPQCTLCQQGETPPEPEKIIPLLATTCGELNDYASLFSKADCALKLSLMDYNAAGFCGCAYHGPLMQCDFCATGASVQDPKKVPLDSPDGTTCGQLEEFARYIWTPTALCTNVRGYAEECCS